MTIKVRANALHYFLSTSFHNSTDITDLFIVYSLAIVELKSQYSIYHFFMQYLCKFSFLCDMNIPKFDCCDSGLLLLFSLQKLYIANIYLKPGIFKNLPLTLKGISIIVCFILLCSDKGRHVLSMNT